MTPEPIWRAPQRFAPVRGAGWRLAVRVVARVEVDQLANVSADPAQHLLLREHARGGLVAQGGGYVSLGSCLASAFSRGAGF